MAITQREVLQAIYDLIYDSLTLTPQGHGGAPAANRKSTYLTLAVPGAFLDEDLLENPWSPQNPNGSMVAAESFARLSDPIPVMQPYHVDSGISLDSIYGEIVRANIAPSVSSPVGLPRRAPPPDVRRSARERGLQHPADLYKLMIATLPSNIRRASNTLYSAMTLTGAHGEPVRLMAETSSHLRYLEKKAAYDAAMTRLMAAHLQAEVELPDSKLSADVGAALADLRQADTAEVERALATMQDFQGGSVVLRFAAARLQYELTRKGSILDPGLFWHTSFAVPSSWLSPNAPFAGVTIRADPLRLDDASHIEGPSSQARSLFRHRSSPNDPWSEEVPESGSVELRISYKFAKVAVLRPWLDASLLSLAGWSLPGRAQSSLSTGTLDNNPGIFSLLPSCMIVARDVRISARWSEEDAYRIERGLRSDDDFCFGPFALSGLKAQPVSGQRITSTFDGITISAEGLQVIGWLSNLVPACPPLDG